MGFRKGSTLNRKDSINDCTFKSFKKFFKNYQEEKENYSYN